MKTLLSLRKCLKVISALWHRPFIYSLKKCCRVDLYLIYFFVTQQATVTNNLLLAKKTMQCCCITFQIRLSISSPIPTVYFHFQHQYQMAAFLKMHDLKATFTEIVKNMPT